MDNEEQSVEEPTAAYQKLVYADKQAYHKAHYWIKTKFGKAQKCTESNCRKWSKTYEWSNISGLCLLDREDWRELCRSCHSLADHKAIWGDACRRGHPRSAINTHISRQGRYVCRLCVNYSRKLRKLKRITELAARSHNGGE